MNIASLLPGLREVRGPLFAGYIWLLCAWLIWGDSLAPDPNDNVVYERLHDAADAVGKVGLFGVLSVVAYLVGSMFSRFLPALSKIGWSSLRQPRVMTGSDLAALIEESTPWKGPGWGRLRPRRGATLRAVTLMFLLGEVAVNDDGKVFESLVKEELNERSRGYLLEALPAVPNDLEFRLTLPNVTITKADGSPWRRRAPMPTFRVERELANPDASLVARLQRVSPEKAENVLRKFGEAEFRQSLVPPLSALVAVLVIAAHPVWVLAALIPIVLAGEAVAIRREMATDMNAVLTALDGQDRHSVVPAFSEYRRACKELHAALPADSDSP